ncbi:hypothetical protein OO014_01255 [Intrasporangium calvum]|uniref:Uncharacterized protein n=1 Tax=Intrasporangium calvum TaxID=53358 RepID=A0ABT5GCC4_9MICO|nr:hypothetical protein [Intrasporangium calvum]MDC5695869.1 hypothetical protein [Intrasporangium calvum]
MSNPQRERGGTAVLVVALASLLLGGGAAYAAVQVVAAQAPNDTAAVETGPQQTIAPTVLIPYGG